MSNFPEKTRYEGGRFDVINVTRGWVGGGPISRKKCYVIIIMAEMAVV